jgi:serine phosphatase RsbU (regulator of sigma subunit)
MKNYSKALEYFEISRQLNDSIFNIEKHKQLSEMDAKYQGDKKQKEIELLNKDKKLQAYEVRSQKLQKYALTGGLLLMVILSIVVLQSYRNKKKANRLLEEQKKKIEEKNEELNQRNEEICAQRDEIEAQRDEITSQRDLVTEQKDHIEKIHDELTSSIRYAQRIQRAVLPDADQMNELLGNSFILFKPRDIVSGDFYWAAKIKQWLIFCVADCTGHGVPGAFMSMLGISLLNEITRREEVNNAGQALNVLRENLIAVLQQKGISGGQNISASLNVKDGMDIALCAYNTETRQLQFAGANNPLYIIRTVDKHSRVYQQYELTEIKGDKMPVGTYAVMKPFTNHVIDISAGDTIYIFSDGFADQFSGQTGRKFKYTQFKDLLDVIQEKSMSEQKIVLENMIEEWKGNCRQTDDILVIGVKL